MAQTTGPLFSMNASGTIGDALTFQTWKGRTTTRLRPVPANPKSLAQRQARAGVIAVNEMWRSLSQSQKDQWEALSEEGQFTKYNAFTKQNLNRKSNGHGLEVTPTGGVAWSNPVVDFVDFFGSAGKVTITISLFGATLATDWLGFAIVNHPTDVPGSFAESILITQETFSGSAEFFIEQLPPSTYGFAAYGFGTNGEVVSIVSTAGIVVT